MTDVLTNAQIGPDELFRSCDTDGSGSLSLGELTTALEGATPLHRCAEVGATACARALLGAGATLERDKRGDSPLHVAAVRGHVDCMKCLVLASKNHGVDTPRAADIRQSLADAPPAPPASDWIRYAYEDGTPYWYNPKTDESQWHEPGTAPPQSRTVVKPRSSMPLRMGTARAYSRLGGIVLGMRRLATFEQPALKLHDTMCRSI